MFYEVTIGFAGFLGVENTYSVDADNDGEAIEIARLRAENDIYVRDVEEIGNGEYEVTVDFSNYIGAEEYYTVMADNEDEADAKGFEEATNDLHVISLSKFDNYMKRNQEYKKSFRRY